MRVPQSHSTPATTNSGKLRMCVTIHCSTSVYPLASGSMLWMDVKVPGKLAKSARSSQAQIAAVILCHFGTLSRSSNVFISRVLVETSRLNPTVGRVELGSLKSRVGVLLRFQWRGRAYFRTVRLYIVENPEMWVVRVQLRISSPQSFVCRWQEKDCWGRMPW